MRDAPADPALMYVLALVWVVSFAFVAALVEPRAWLAFFFVAVLSLFVVRAVLIADERLVGWHSGWELAFSLFSLSFGGMGVVWLMSLYRAASIVVFAVVLLGAAVLFFSSLRHSLFNKTKVIFGDGQFSVAGRSFILKEVYSVLVLGSVYVALSKDEDEGVCKGMVLDPKYFGGVFSCSPANAGELERFLRTRGFVEELTPQQRKLFDSLGEEAALRLVNPRRKKE